MKDSVSIAASILAAIASGLTIRNSHWQTRVAKSTLRGEPSSQSTPARRNRFPRVLAIALLFASLAVVGFVYSIRQLNGKGENNEALLTLRSLVPTPVSPTCRVYTSIPNGVVAALSCQRHRAAYVYKCMLFSSDAGLRRYLAARLEETGVPQGDCSRQARAYESYDEGAAPAGTELCLFGAHAATIEWSQTALHIYATITGPPGQRLEVARAWRDAGPSSANDVQAFPDQAEADLLSHVPKNFRGSCTRLNWSQSGVIASVSCRKGSIAVDYASFADQPSLQKYWRGEKASPVQNANASCVGGQNVPYDRTYSDSDGDRGERICYVTGHTPTIEWVDSTKAIYGYATSDGGSLGALYRWWNSDSGPVY